LPARPTTPAEARVHSTHEPDELASALIGGTFELMPVPGAVFTARLRILRVADMIVQHGENGAHVLRGGIADGLCALIVPLRYDHSLAWMNGAEIQETQGFLAPGGVEFRGHMPGPHAWAALAVPSSRMERWFDLAAPPLLRAASQTSVLGFEAAAQQRFNGMMAAAARMADAPPESLVEPGTADAMAAALADALLDLVGSGVHVLPRPRAAREAHRVVRAAEDYLHADIGRPIFREQLCAALGVSLRKLHDAFVSTTGMSPQAYLKTRRLMLVRRSLRERDARPPLVKSVALAHGFWHLGHFARDYRMLFGESPSATMGRAERRPYALRSGNLRAA
jgi:AraC-like DNA-binding protein